jgi:hypothetical protein
MILFKKLINIIKIVINQPLSVLRFTLSILIGKKLIEELFFIYEVSDNAFYELTSTWFLNLLPKSLFVFNDQYFTLYLTIIIIASIGSALGILGRLNLIVLAFFSYFLFGISEGIGIFDHHLSLPTQVIFALALVPSSMKLSIDYLLLKFYKSKKHSKSKIDLKNPKWGFNIILTLVALTYFTAGISKLRYGHGLNWLDGSTLGFYLNERTNFYKDGEVQIIIGDSEISKENNWKDKFGFIAHTYGNYQSSPKLIAISDYLKNNKIALILLSIGSVLFELLAFIVFINSRYRNIYLISAMLFHMSIGALMGISFRQYRVICFLLIDWSVIFDYITKKLKRFKIINTTLSSIA